MKKIHRHLPSRVIAPPTSGPVKKESDTTTFVTLVESAYFSGGMSSNRTNVREKIPEAPIP
jgi:hypothetical protein